MKRVLTLILAMGFITLLLSGCATNRGIIRLHVPEASRGMAATGKSVVIRSVRDHRVFEKEPDSPSIPSLGFGGAESASEELKKRAIARKRNGYGKALGDILLAEGQTVESLVRDALVRAFSESGYTVLPGNEGVNPDTLRVDATISKCWSWMNPGFWGISLHSEIETRITVENFQGYPLDIHVQSKENYQAASEGNWIAIMNKGLEAYNNQLKEQLLQAHY